MSHTYQIKVSYVDLFDQGARAIFIKKKSKVIQIIRLTIEINVFTYDSEELQQGHVIWHLLGGEIFRHIVIVAKRL